MKFQKVSKLIVMCVICILFIICTSGISFSENKTILSDKFHEYIFVDTAPVGENAATKPITVKNKINGGLPGVWFSIGSITGSPTFEVTLQTIRSSDPNATWTDYVHDDNPYSGACRIFINDAETGVRWRAIIKVGKFSGTGSLIYGFGW